MGRGLLTDALKNFIFSMSQGAEAAAKNPTHGGLAAFGASLAGPQVRQEMLRQQSQQDEDRALKIMQIRQQMQHGNLEDALSKIQALTGMPEQDVPAQTGAPVQLPGVNLPGSSPIPSMTVGGAGLPASTMPLPSVNVPGIGQVTPPSMQQLQKGKAQAAFQEAFARQQAEALFKEPPRPRVINQREIVDPEDPTGQKHITANVNDEGVTTNPATGKVVPNPVAWEKPAAPPKPDNIPPLTRNPDLIFNGQTVLEGLDPNDKDRFGKQFIMGQNGLQDVTGKAKLKPKDTTIQEQAQWQTSYSSSYNHLQNDIRKPVDSVAANIGTAKTLLAQNDPGANSLAAPAIIKAVVGGADSGVRITTPEINAVNGGRGKIDNFKSWLSSWSTDPKAYQALLPDQKQWLNGVLDLMNSKIQKKQAAISTANQALVDAKDAHGHAQVMKDLNDAIEGIDQGAPSKTKTPAPQINSNNPLGIPGF